ncbi:MAG TPA: L,D-transpeptidase family protein [Blastocatellia bacterium]|jgi:lipoprotein-anchoring transpeptidase ErfK/SrfK
MGNQIQQSQIRGSIRIAGRGLLAAAFALLVVANAGVAQPGRQSPDRQSEDQQSSPAPKSKRQARTLSGREISEARELLNQLGYWVTLGAKGNDASLRQALIAFQKIEGRNPTGVWTVDELEALRGAQKPRAFETGYPHIEVDLHRQVLFIVDAHGVDLRILPISSASGEFFTQGGDTRQAITPTGRFKVYHKVEGWRKSPLGLLYYPNYIHYGIAIHGNPSVPTRPASHGCIRIPMFAAREFSKIASIGMVVIVYDTDPLAEVGPGAPEQR